MADTTKPTEIQARNLAFRKKIKDFSLQYAIYIVFGALVVLLMVLAVWQ